MLYKQHMHCAVEVMAVEMRWDYPRCDGLIGTGMQVATTSFPRMAHTKHIESKFPNFRHFIAYLDILVTNILYLNKYDNISIFNFPWQKMQYFSWCSQNHWGQPFTRRGYNHISEVTSVRSFFSHFLMFNFWYNYNTVSHLTLFRFGFDSGFFYTKKSLTISMKWPNNKKPELLSSFWNNLCHRLSPPRIIHSVLHTATAINCHKSRSLEEREAGNLGAAPDRYSQLMC